jgi:hypothetical protein
VGRKRRRPPPNVGGIGLPGLGCLPNQVPKIVPGVL